MAAKVWLFAPIVAVFGGCMGDGDSEPLILAENERIDFEAGDVFTQEFELGADGLAIFSIESRSGDYFDWALMPSGEEDFWAEGQSARTYDDGDNTRAVDNQVDLTKGRHVLAIRCTDPETPCTLSWSLRVESA